jgi:hypothetical protein
MKKRYSEADLTKNIELLALASSEAEFETFEYQGIHRIFKFFVQ